MTRDVSPSIEDIHLESRTEEKEKTLKLIEQKLKSYEEKKEQEASNQPQAVKKKGHFWSDCKVNYSSREKKQISKLFCLSNNPEINKTKYFILRRYDHKLN